MSKKQHYTGQETRMALQRNKSGLLVPLDSKALKQQWTHDGIALGMNIRGAYDRAAGMLQSALVAISIAALCNHGEQTKAVLRDCERKFADCFIHYRHVIQDINNSGFITVQMPPEMEQLRDLHRLLRGYTDKPTAQAQRALSEMAQYQVTGMEKLHDKIAGLIELDARGRDADSLKLALGRLSIEKGTPAPRKAWLQGYEIYCDLCAEPTRQRSTEQKALITLLSTYMTSDGRSVLSHERRNLGIYLQEARALVIKSGN